MRASQQRIILIGAVVYLLLSMPLNFLANQEDQKLPSGIRLGNYILTGVSKKDLDHKLTSLAADFSIKPKNAHKQPESLQLVQERMGFELDIEQTKKLVLRAKQGERIEPIYRSIPPLIKIEDIQQDTLAHAQKLGTDSTPIVDSSEQAERIRLIAESLNNTVVEPAQEFSFQRIKGMLPNEQIASILNNVATKTHMDILDDENLLFRNTLTKPMIIKCWVGDGQVNVAFFTPEIH